MENDLALSKHVLHVHKYLRNPTKAIESFSPAIVKQYIASARTVSEPCIGSADLSIQWPICSFPFACLADISDCS